MRVPTLLNKSLDSDGAVVMSTLRGITAYPYSDHRHPKLRVVADEVVRRWREGEKSLVFCFRVPTAIALHDLISRLVKKELDHARRSLFRTRGTTPTTGNEPMQQFRRSLTARDSSGVPLFLDRVLFAWLDDKNLPFPELIDADLVALADLCARARYKEKPLFPNYVKPDRVFLHRAIEHVLAKRLLHECGDLDDLLTYIASEDWIKYRYGEYQLRADDGDQLNRPEYLARSSVSAVFDLNTMS